MSTDHVLTHVSERDVDLLLVEEFCCSPSFFSWFANRLRPSIGDSAVDFVSAKHSVSTTGDGGGETDIEVRAVVTSGGRRCRMTILIEDKIDATFTELQPDRYTRRAKELVTGGACEKALCVLVAPASYSCAGDSRFDLRISYEELIAYFRERDEQTEGELRRRSQYRRALIEQALHRFRRGYVLKPVAEVTSFWQEYWSLCEEVAPELRMPRPQDKPGDSYSVPFPCLPQDRRVPRASLYHVMKKGTVDLLFSGASSDFDQLVVRLQQHLERDMRPRRAGKSLSITINVPPLDTLRPLSEQADVARAGPEAAIRLKHWLERHMEQLAEAFAARE